MANEPNLLKREIRAFERWMEEVSATWPQELRDLGKRKLLALNMLDQPDVPPILVRETAKDEVAFDEAYTTFFGEPPHAASKGA